MDDETVICRKKYKKRDVIIVKAKGPGGRVGNPGRVVERIVATAEKYGVTLGFIRYKDAA